MTGCTVGTPSVLRPSSWVRNNLDNHLREKDETLTQGQVWGIWDEQSDSRCSISDQDRHHYYICSSDPNPIEVCPWIKVVMVKTSMGPGAFSHVLIWRSGPLDLHVLMVNTSCWREWTRVLADPGASGSCGKYWEADGKIERMYVCARVCGR